MPTPCMLNSGTVKLFTGKVNFLTIRGEIWQARVKTDTAKIDKHEECCWKLIARYDKYSGCKATRS